MLKNSKYIALIDCDSFFCSCERKLNPDLEGKPLCVVSGNRGCVISRSKEAKDMGIPMGMPLFQAVRQFPECIYINAVHSNYLEISKQIMAILRDFSPTVEVYSIDEAFMDLTGLTKLYGMNYYELAKHIRQKIKTEVNMPVSIGVSRSKTLAKLASDRAKNSDNGVVLIGKCKIKKYLKKVDISEIWGIGYRLTKRCHTYGIITAEEFVKTQDKIIKTVFGMNGMAMKYELLGDSVLPINAEYELPKSISDTQSFEEFTSDLSYLKNELMVHIHSVSSKLRRINCKCQRIGLIVKTKDFRYFFEEKKLPCPTNFELDISKYALELLDKIYSPEIIYRSIGIVLEDFIEIQSEQLSLFDENNKKLKSENLGKAIDNLENRFGKNIVRIGFKDKEVRNKQDFMSKPNGVY